MAEPDQFNYASDGTIYNEGHAIRLVRLCAGTSQSIRCHLFKAYIHEAGIPYEALSYTWGDSARTCKISMNDQTFWVTENLYVALQHLRLADEDRILWIDAISIDQGRNEEKNHQVWHMPAIYAEAWRVIYWLGSSTTYTNLLLSALAQLQRLVSKMNSRQWHFEDSHWKSLWQDHIAIQWRMEDLVIGLEDLLRSPWFRRVWILQECSHAKSGIVACGTRSVSCRVFLLAPSLLSTTPRAHCLAVLGLMPGFRGDSHYSMQQDLFNLLLRFRESAASDPRDKIYALLSIATDGMAYTELDYEKSFCDVYRDVSIFLFSPHFKWRKHLIDYSTVEGLFSDLTRLNNVALIDATEQGDLNVVRKLSSRPAVDFDFKNADGRCVLLEASQRGLTDVARHLLTIPSTADYECTRGLPLQQRKDDAEESEHHTSRMNHTPKLNVQDHAGRSIVQLAARSGKLSLVRLFMEHPRFDDINEFMSPRSIIIDLTVYLMEDLTRGLTRDLCETLKYAMQSGQSEIYSSIFSSGYLRMIVSHSRALRTDSEELLSRLRPWSVLHVVGQFGVVPLMCASEARNLTHVDSAKVQREHRNTAQRKHNEDPSSAIMKWQNAVTTELLHRQAVDINVEILRSSLMPGREAPLMLEIAHGEDGLGILGLLSQIMQLTYERPSSRRQIFDVGNA